MCSAPCLPIDELIPDILKSLEQNPNLVIEAEPGAGKTTRVPAALLRIVGGDVLVLEPRRLAARCAARHVAHSLRENLGRTVGYQVRFERVGGSGTRLHFLTEGVLTRRLLSDPDLCGVDAVVLDEFHERHLESDLALALLKRLQRKRPKLHIVVMSATLESASVAEFLGRCPVLRSTGKQFALSIEHLPYSPDPLHEQVRSALDQVLSADRAGDVLIFLPGAAEIRRSMHFCQSLAEKFDRIVLPLHGDLTPAEQDRAVLPSSRPKIILSTNVAETSVTIEGVRTVIDGGLARMASYSPWTGLPTVHLARISKAAARQRAGRAARNAPGHVVRLYSKADYQTRPDFEKPEILRSDLAQLCLALRALGIESASSIQWLDAPDDLALQSAETLLDLLGIRSTDARDLMRLPLHPRLARVIHAAIERKVARSACVVAALFSSGERSESSDVLDAIERPLGEPVQQQLRHFLRLVKPGPSDEPDEDALLQAVLKGFPDRVAQRRSGNQVVLENGTAAEILGEAPSYPLMLALDAEHRTENALPKVRVVARVEPEWLLDHYPERVREEASLVWNRSAERVDAVSKLVYGVLVLQESICAPTDPVATGDLLADKAIEAGIERFVDDAGLQDLVARMEFAGMEVPDISSKFREYCYRCRSFADLKRSGDRFLRWLEGQTDCGRLRENAPRTLHLKSGRQVNVHYERGKAPWIESRLQDFFGMNESPRLGPDHTPVVVHLLAPNHRPVQTTSDLAGFWLRLYPQVRRELMRRYPRHAWPEDHQPLH